MLTVALAGSLRVFIHGDILASGVLDLLIILKAKEVFEFREIFLMSRHEIVHIVDPIPSALVVAHKPAIGLFRRSVTCQKEHLVDVSEALQMLPEELEHAKDLCGQFSVKAEAS